MRDRRPPGASRVLAEPRELANEAGAVGASGRFHQILTASREKMPGICGTGRLDQNVICEQGNGAFLLVASVIDAEPDDANEPKQFDEVIVAG